MLSPDPTRCNRLVRAALAGTDVLCCGPQHFLFMLSAVRKVGALSVAGPL